MGIVKFDEIFSKTTFKFLKNLNMPSGRFLNIPKN